jgi:hypothetical protein
MITLVWIILTGYPGNLMLYTDVYTTKAQCIAEVARTREAERMAGISQGDYWCHSLVLR